MGEEKKVVGEIVGKHQLLVQQRDSMGSAKTCQNARTNGEEKGNKRGHEADESTPKENRKGVPLLLSGEVGKEQSITETVIS